MNHLENLKLKLSKTNPLDSERINSLKRRIAKMEADSKEFQRQQDYKAGWKHA